ncbi:MAG TPA: hypothetical protein VLY23_12640 [Candidatus Acidoferrum sp.]|nr:hypothetical protein [Candidatus Acidoferrum sp.]
MSTKLSHHLNDGADSRRGPGWHNEPWHGVLKLFLGVVLLVSMCASGAKAQSQDVQFDDMPKPVPVFSAGMGFIAPFEGGQPHLDPLVSPVFLIPLGDRWLVESRDTFESDLSTPPGSNSFHGVVQKEVDYLQLDYIANPYMTVTVGRYLTPFGIYNERLYPIWIRDLQSDPLILPIATGPSGAGTGAMVRGGFPLSDKVNLNYAAYFSALSTVSPLDSSRMAGGRVGIFLPGPRLEIGGSFQHLLQDDRSNSFGFHFEWQPSAVPLDLRSEYARSSQGSGYWVESAYRLSQIPKAQDQFRKIQMVARMQQFFTGTYSSGGWGDLPPWNTQEFEFGINYYFRDNLRGVSSYGRQFSSWGNENVWTLGFTYRFAVPLGHGE